MKIKLMSFIIAILVLGTVGATISEDYLNEFNVKGESCQIIDAFVYDISDPWLFDSDHKFTTLPVIYTCCIEESCTSVIFDVENKIFLTNNYLEEIIDLNYIRYNLHNGNLSENYFQTNGLDLCDTIGFKEAKQQSLNLASEVVESGAVAVGTEKAYQVSKTIKAARDVGVIGKFNPTILIAGVACGYDDKQLDSVLENVVILNAYLKNINEGYSQEGYVSNLINSLSNSKYYLEQYVKSPTAIARGGLSWIMNIFKFLFDTASSPQEIHEIEKTKYQIAQDTLREISNYNFYLSNPNKEEIIQKHNSRVSLKNSQFEKAYNEFRINYNELIAIRPSGINVLFTNLFYSPNFNLSEGESCFSKITLDKKASEKYYKEYKFNSAINALNSSEDYFNCSKEVFMRESNIERKFDTFWIWLILVCLAITAIIKFDLIEKIKDAF